MRIALTAVLVAILLPACVDPDDPEVSSEAQSVSAAGPYGGTSDREVPRRSGFWFYDDRGIDRGTSWRTGSTTGMKIGAAPLGYGEDYLKTGVSYGPDPNHKYRTTYFRSAFYARPGVKKMFLRVMYDDGFVFYLNGKEGGRASMPSGAVSYGTYALGHEANNQYVTFDISSQIPNLLSNANNDLAIEVHQASDASSDLVLDAELILWDGFDTTSFYTENGIQRDSWWRFDDRGTDLGTAWRAKDFDDHAWSSGEGPLGFGEQYTVTDTHPGPITTYFRAKFIAHGVVDALSADIMYDDGFVAYLNGTEIARVGMPAGTITASTLATNHEANNEYSHFTWRNVDGLIDHDGLNTLAIEVHQTAATSSDLVFDAEITPLGAWTTQHPGTDEALLGVWFTDAQNGWVVGDHGTVLQTTDGGTLWRPRLDLPTGTTNLTDVTFTDAMHGWIIGAGGTIVRTTDGGATWMGMAVIPTSPQEISCPDSDHCGMAGYDNLLYTSDNGGAGWSSHDPGAGATATFWSISFADPMHGWATGMVPNPNHSDSWAAIYATSDGGATWTQQYISGFHFQYLFKIEAVDATTIWAVGESSLSTDGEVKLVSHDGGQTWTEAAETSNGQGLLSIGFGDATHGCAVGWYGGIVCTRDAGATWQVSEEMLYQQRPSYGDVHFVDANTGWAVGEHGTIVKTTTGGY